MPVKWKLFRLVCVLQILITAIHAGYSLINMFLTESYFFGILNAAGFICMLLLANLGLNLMTYNYPNEPVNDAQKSKFNWLFLINFFLLAFSSGYVFKELRKLIDSLGAYNSSVADIPVSNFLPLLIYVCLFVFHVLILYGLFVLRRLLYSNYLQNTFEFEKKQKA